MEVHMPDSTISDQGATTTVGAGLDAGGQEAGRVNGLMSALGKRTSERDDAYAERDRLRDELAALMSADQPATDGPGAAAEPPQLPASEGEPIEAPDGTERAQERITEPSPPEYMLPVGSVVTTPDGSQYLVGSAGPATIAPTSPSRSAARPSTELEQARQRFAAELPGMVAEIEDRALLRGR